MKKYRVTWKIELSRDIEANSAAEAILITEDLGDTDAESQASNKRAKLINNILEKGSV